MYSTTSCKKLLGLRLAQRGVRTALAEDPGSLWLPPFTTVLSRKDACLPQPRKHFDPPTPEEDLRPQPNGRKLFSFWKKTDRPALAGSPARPLARAQPVEEPPPQPRGPTLVTQAASPTPPPKELQIPESRPEETEGNRRSASASGLRLQELFRLLLRLRVL